MKKVLLIEDNEQLRKYIHEYLSAYELEVHMLDDYDSVVENVSNINPDIILLDINLPKLDGFYYLKLIRKYYKIPIIIISARSEESEQIRGIESGADDYITKPFSIGILLAKINAMMRRTNTSTNNTYLQQELILYSEKMKAEYKNNIIELTKNEFKVLQLLVKNAGQIITREEILEELWDDISFVDDNTLTVNMTRVKKKLLELGIKNAISTKRGVGYVFEMPNIKNT